MLCINSKVVIVRMALMISTLKSLGTVVLISFVLSSCQALLNSNVGEQIKTENNAGGGGGSSY